MNPTQQKIAALKKAIASSVTPANIKENMKKKLHELETSEHDRGEKSTKAKMASKKEKRESPKAKSADYNCDELIEAAKKRSAKAKQRAAGPKKTEATKVKKAIEKVEDRIEDKYKKMSRAEITKLIAETRSLLKLLEATLKKMK